MSPIDIAIVVLVLIFVFFGIKKTVYSIKNGKCACCSEKCECNKKNAELQKATKSGLRRKTRKKKLIKYYR
ncbi:hypothetical protein [Fenollaria sporofastidiosus]|uniref:hypothetical protein n=1 Tax=Fenollaria sporofastidiosus TaxID=2811778 RepID=UPI001BFFF0FA|nr:hypothetical protein [Fenollaria sporofastidiosus]